ncbi:MAG: photosynthetic complex putative assembly protein PuhB [Geminicoccaceae bacterium]
MSDYVPPPRGLPGHLPEGERILWQGAPQTAALARRTFHGRAVAVYFAIVLAGAVVTNVAEGASPAATALAILWVAPLAMVAVGLIMLFAWLTSRTTVYTITNRRLVLRVGIALPATINLPFATIGSAGVRTFPDGTADIPLTVTGPDAVAYMMLWPHARPWRLSRAEPMLRAVPDGAQVAAILARALAAAAEQPVQAVGAALPPVATHGPVPAAA